MPLLLLLQDIMGEHAPEFEDRCSNLRGRRSQAGHLSVLCVLGISMKSGSHGGSRTRQATRPMLISNCSQARRSNERAQSAAYKPDILEYRRHEAEIAQA